MFANYGYEEGMKQILAKQIRQILEREGLCQKKVQSAKIKPSFFGKTRFLSVLEPRGDVAAILSPGAWSGTLFPELYVTHRFRAVAPLLESHLFDIWVMSFRRHTVCLSGVTESGHMDDSPYIWHRLWW